MGITKLFVNRPTLVTVVLAAIALAGAVSYATLVNQQFPNIDFPTIQVRASYPGGSPTEIRDAIVRPLEDAIAGAPNLDHLNVDDSERASVDCRDVHARTPTRRPIWSKCSGAYSPPKATCRAIW